MLLHTLFILLFTFGGFQKLERSGVSGLVVSNGVEDNNYRHRRDTNESTTTAPTSETDPAKQKELLIAEKYRQDTIETYRTEAAQRMLDLKNRLKSSIGEQAETSPGPNGKNPIGLEKLDSEIQGLQNKLASVKTDILDVDKAKGTKVNSKVEVVIEAEEKNPCDSLLGKLGCLLG